ncbi:hypothetical protein NUZ5A_20546 [Candidatus Nitrosotenuis uzonensis]|uniref:Uncharacterized protein n=1 Tax=Candidatus Nitrosotenuis uzonensis TaxID=1407055 RepID=A0A812EYR1_9ARCH|nr:hypothetical protein NUZ5A_20546 [Candidatus Nitrosotenuis uzonensis]
MHIMLFMVVFLALCLNWADLRTKIEITSCTIQVMELLQNLAFVPETNTLHIMLFTNSAENRKSLYLRRN